MTQESCVSQPMLSAMKPQEGPTERSCLWVSPARQRRKELLRRGVPKSQALDNLREKILEQRRARLRALANQERALAKEGILVNKVQHGVQMTRKVCRVTFSLKGGGSGCETAVRSSSRGACERKSRAKRAPARSAAPPTPPLQPEHSANISAWRDAQKLMKHFLGSTRTEHFLGSTRTARISAPRQRAKENVEPSPQNTKENVEPSPQNTKENVEPSPQHAKENVEPSPQRAKENVEPSPQRAKENVEPSPQNTNSLTAPVGPPGLINKPCSTDKSQATESHTQLQHTLTKSHTQPGDTPLAGRRPKAELQEFMRRQGVVRKRRMRRQAREAEEEEERRKSRLQELTRRQRDALMHSRRRTRDTPAPEKSSAGSAVAQREAARRPWSRLRTSLHTGGTAQTSVTPAAGTRGHVGSPGQVWSERTPQVRPTPLAETGGDVGSPLRSPVQVWGARVGSPVQVWGDDVGSPVQVRGARVGSPVQVWGDDVESPVQVRGDDVGSGVLEQTQRERVEALKDAAAVLDARLEEALALCRPRDLRLTPHTHTAPQSGPRDLRLTPHTVLDSGPRDLGLTPHTHTAPDLGPTPHTALDSGPDVPQLRPASQTPPRASPPTETAIHQTHRLQTPALTSPCAATPTNPAQSPHTPTRASLCVGTATGQAHRGSAERSVFSAGLQRDGHTQPVKELSAGRDGHTQPVEELSAGLRRDGHTQPVEELSAGLRRDGHTQPVEELSAGLRRDGHTQPAEEGTDMSMDARAGAFMGHAERPVPGTSSTTRPTSSSTSSSSDSSSKWSELSELYSQGALEGQLSLAQSMQFLREEELRARHAGALFRLRAEALRERTQAELTLLDQWRSELGPGEHEALTHMNRKRDDVIRLYQQEQEGRSSAPWVEVIAELRRDDQASEQQSSNTDEQQPATPLDPPGFLTKARLRRLLMSDDVWSFGRKRHPAEFAPDEDAVVPAPGAEGQQNGQDEPDEPPRYPPHRPGPPPQQVRDEGEGPAANAAKTPGHQRDHSNTSLSTNQETNPNRFSSLLEQRVLRRPCPKKDPEQPRVTVLPAPDRVPVCGFRTRPLVPDRQNPAPAPHVPLTREGESLCSDCETTSGHHASSAQEASTITLNNLSDVDTDSSDTETDTASLNVRNNQRSQSALSLNNNHENRLNLATSDPERPGETLPLPPLPPPPLAASTAEAQNTHTHTPPPETLMRGAVLANTPSVDSGSELQKTACDSSPSGADNMSSLSLSTESLGSSDDDSHGDKTAPHLRGGHPYRCASPGPRYEPYQGQMSTRDWEERLGQMSGRDWEERLGQMSGRDGEERLGQMGTRDGEERLGQMGTRDWEERLGQMGGRDWEERLGQMGGRDWEERLGQPDDDGEKVLDSLLSEILSPVDEVLSYGSAELPPSARGAPGAGTISASFSFSLPPAPPAYEVITWTSEEDLPPPPREDQDQDQDHGPGEDPSIASEHVPSLPPDSPLPPSYSPPPPPPPLPPLPPPPVMTESSVPADWLDSFLADGVDSLPADGVDSFLCRRVEVLDEDEDDDEDEVEGLSGSVPLCSENEDLDRSENTTSLPVDEGNDTSDPLSSFHIGDRVLVCHSRPGVLRFKGPTAFAGGTWAGVVLDGPNGNHDGTFRGVKYFTCERNRGVLVRAEDISHLPREPGSDVDTGLDDDPFSDEEPPRGSKPQQREEGSGNLFSSGTSEQKGGGSQSSSNVASSAPRRTCGDFKHRCSLQANEAVPQPRCSTLRKGMLPTEGDSCVSSAASGLNNNTASESSAAARLASWPMDAALKEAYATRSRRQLCTEGHRARPRDLKKMEDIFRPCSVDQWHSDRPPDTPSRVPVCPHDCEIVYRLVDAAVDVLCGSESRDVAESCEVPSYLINDDKSHLRYRQVFFELTSDVYQEVFSDVISTDARCQRADATTVSSSKLSVRDIKVVIKREIQKILNLEKSEKQMQEMLQTLCKFWHTKRDKVDYILIQELQREDQCWVDYSVDQNTVKTQLTEDIFSLLLDDTINVLRAIQPSTHS